MQRERSNKDKKCQQKYIDFLLRLEYLEKSAESIVRLQFNTFTMFVSYMFMSVLSLTFVCFQLPRRMNNKLSNLSSVSMAVLRNQRLNNVNQ